MVCFFTYLTNVDCVFRKHWIYCPWLCICGKIFVPFVMNITLKISHVSNIFFKGYEIKKWLYPLKKLNVKYILRWPSVPKGVLLLFLSDRLVKPPRYLNRFCVDSAVSHRVPRHLSGIYHRTLIIPWECFRSIYTTSPLAV